MFGLVSLRGDTQVMASKIPSRKFSSKSYFKLPPTIMSLADNVRHVTIALYYLGFLHNDQRFKTSVRQIAKYAGISPTTTYRVLNSEVEHFAVHKAEQQSGSDSLEITLACWPYDLSHGTRAETANGTAERKAKKPPRYLERDYLGFAPSKGTEPLPEPLQELFRSQGKEEAYPNVWILESDYDELCKAYGTLRVDAAAGALTAWSLSLGLSARGVPHWVSYRQLRDHRKILEKRILGTRGQA